MDQNLWHSPCFPETPSHPDHSTRGCSFWSSICYPHPSDLYHKSNSPRRVCFRPAIRPSCLYKNSLFLGYHTQGDVGLPGDPGRPLVNGFAEFGVPKGNKGTQVCVLTLLTEIKRTKMSLSQGTPSSYSLIQFCSHFPHHSSHLISSRLQHQPNSPTDFKDIFVFVSVLSLALGLTTVLLVLL